CRGRAKPIGIKRAELLKNFELGRVIDFDQRTAAPLDPTADEHSAALQREQIHPGICELAPVRRLYRNGEVLPPILAKVQVNSSSDVRCGQNLSLDELVRAPEAEQLPVAISWPYLIRRMPP